jgi:hypothetical protein
MNTSAEMANVREIIRLASTNHGFISVNGYTSKSGQIANITVQPLGADGYHKLIAKSIAEAPQLERPSKFDEETWAKALEGQIKSWQKTLDGGHERKNNFTKESKGFDNHAENDAVYIRNFVIISKDVTTEGEYKTVNSAPLTKAKGYLRKNTAVGKYQGQMKLEIGTFNTVKFKGATIKG